MNRGSALLAVLLVLLLISVLGVALLRSSTDNFKMLSSERDYMAVYYIAEAGLQQQIEGLRFEIEKLSQFPDLHGEPSEFFEILKGIKPACPSFGTLNGKSVELDCTIHFVEEYGDAAVLHIISNAKLGNITRSAEAFVEVKWTLEGGTPVEFGFWDLTIIQWKERLQRE